MKKHFLILLNKIINSLSTIQDRFTNQENDTLEYNSLSPIDNADPDGLYSNALLWAIKNRKNKDIKNIALTGPYGSGKSSIIKTFQKNYRGNDLKFLNISLATFKEEKEKKEEVSNINKENTPELLRLIEISILQQIFYHEEDKKIPDSRFKKIKSFSQKHLITNSIGLLLFILSIIYFVKPSFIKFYLKDYELNILIKNIIHYSSLILTISGIYYLIYKSIRTISSFTINKLTIQNAEIGFGDNVSKSILNHHIDEILYFFTVRPYNVVIIEDLDRFRETEIFTKLREINLLLNNSKKTKNKEIIFIYAVRDDMFTDKERTKFFDFIIPVIPVINSSNSSQILLTKKETYNFNLSDNLIDDISVFIDDMRLLHNIINEFNLYIQKLDSNLNHNKLLSILVYKNIYPNDFVKLSNNEGILFDYINSKSFFINVKINKIDKEIQDIKLEIKSFETFKLKNVEELRSLYILTIIKRLKNFNSFTINNNKVSIDAMSEEENFDYLIDNAVNYDNIYRQNSYNPYYERNSKFEFTFKDIEKEVASKSYLERKKEIEDWYSGKTEILKKKVQNLEKDKILIRSYSIQQLIKFEPNFKLPDQEVDNYRLIKLLIKNGYISEDYLDYISIFYEGSISRSDNQFLLCVRNETKLQNNYKLNKIDKIISKLNILYFDTEYILNYDLINFILNHQYYNEYIEPVFNQISNESKASIEFINEFINFANDLPKFINTLCNFWTSIWNYIENNSHYSKDIKSKYLKLILEYADPSTIITIAKVSNLKNTIILHEDFLNFISNKDRLKIIIKILDLKFINIDFDNSPEELLIFIYKNNYYKIEKQITKDIIKHFGKYNQKQFDTSNYSLIHNSGCNLLVDYIYNNTNEYIENVYLKIETNTDDEESKIIELLNDKTIFANNKILLIDKTNTKISNIEDIVDSDLGSYLLLMNKAKATWENLLIEFDNSQEVSESIIKFINILDNAQELSKYKIPKLVNNENKFSKFIRNILVTEEITYESYILISKSVPWWYKDLEFTTLSYTKVEALINNRVLQPVLENFSKLKTEFNPLHIQLLLINKLDYFKKLDEIILDSTDITLIFKSQTFSFEEKSTILENAHKNKIVFDSASLEAIGELLINHPSLKINDKVLEDLIMCPGISIRNRIKIFNIKHTHIDDLLIPDFLENLEEPFSDINIRGKRPLVENNSDNFRHLEILKSKKYISKFEKEKNGLRVSTFRNK